MEMPEQVHKEKRENTALIYGKKGLLFNSLGMLFIYCVCVFKLMQTVTWLEKRITWQ